MEPKNITNKWIYKKKQSHREVTSGYQWGEGKRDG